MGKTLRLVFAVTSLSLFAESVPTTPSFQLMPPPPPSAAPGSLPLVDMFSVEKNPGRGALQYVRSETETSTITFGPETGQYVMGLVFPHDTLPPSIQADYKSGEIIQLVFGTMNRAANGKVGQFGASTLMVSTGSRAQRLVPLRIPGNGDPGLPESGFLLFSAPDMNAQLSDEEKLKGTFFAKGGSVSLSASTSPKPLQVTADGKKLAFKVQAMRMDIQASLSTPFNNEERQLRGKVEFPLYYPDGSSSKRFVRQLAETSFNAKTSIKIPEELRNRRQVSSEPKIKK